MNFVNELSTLIDNASALADGFLSNLGWAKERILDVSYSGTEFITLKLPPLPLKFDLLKLLYLLHFILPNAHELTVEIECNSFQS